MRKTNGRETQKTIEPQPSIVDSWGLIFIENKPAPFLFLYL